MMPNKQFAIKKKKNKKKNHKFILTLFPPTNLVSTSHQLTFKEHFKPSQNQTV